MSDEPIVPPHGGYRRLKTFQLARLICDVTICFCNHKIDRRSRTFDQMVQAARSGVQNIAEGSQASGTSTKMEMKLTSVARASLEELRLDYEDYLRHRDLPLLTPDHPSLARFKRRRCRSLEEVQSWVAEERRLGNTDRHGRTRTHTDDGAMTHSSELGDDVVAKPESSDVLAANAALSLLNLTTYLLDRQLAAQADRFEADGSFIERLHRVRTSRRRNHLRRLAAPAPQPRSSVQVRVSPCLSPYRATGTV